MNATTYGVDLAKHVIQIHWVEAATGEIHRKKLSRGKFAQFFAQRQPGQVAMEACGGAHHWGRALVALGHQVELLPPHQVRGFVTGNKDDAADARGIWLAAQHQDIRRVPVKSAQQQGELAVHRVRSHWVALRTATSNMLRGLLYEFGICLPKGRKLAWKELAQQRPQLEAQLPALVTRMLDAQLQALRAIDEQVQALERELQLVQRASEVASRLAKVPGIGTLGATALASTLGDGSAWRSPREFAACVGLTPAHTGSGGKVRLRGISKRGDGYLRTLLIHGARNLVRCAQPSAWIASLLARRPFNVVVTAVAHKLARIAWAMVAHGRSYEARWKPAPAASV